MNKPNLMHNFLILIRAVTNTSLLAIIAANIKPVYHTVDIEKYILYELYFRVNTVLLHDLTQSKH